MRIAHIITRMIIGGAQENTLHTCQDLMRLFGDDVLLVTGPSLGPEGELLEQGRVGEVPLRTIADLRREIHPWRDYQAYSQLKQVIREFKPDVVHTHSAKGGILGRTAAWGQNVPGQNAPVVIHTVHGAPFHAYQSWPARHFFQWCEWYAARRCHALVSVADAMTDLLVAARIAPREKFTTIYSGMDVQPFLHANDHREETRRQLGLNPDHVVVGKIARLYYLKGHEYLLAVAQQIVSECPQTRFVLVGDGILRQQLEQEIARLGLTDHFRFTGLVEPQRIPALLGAMDIVVHVSLREGLARALPQALIAGKPVVSYDVDGAREVVIPGETGFLVPPQTTAPLSAAVIELARDRQLRERMGARGRERFTDQFRHETMTTQLRALYERLLNHRSG